MIQPTIHNGTTNHTHTYFGPHMNRQLWNKCTIMMSVAINILMLFTWNARATLADFTVYENATALPDILQNPYPQINYTQYDTVLYSLGGAHNFFSFLVLLTYFLSNHPSPPSIIGMWNQFRELWAQDENKDKDDDDDDDDESTLEIKLFSFTTIFYIVFMAMSVMGTIFEGYFFAFHLLNIVNNNQLLRGVIQAVTQNGKSLLWVGVLGFILFYIYALISFALLRSSFDPDSDMYCADLWQCTVSVIRYGLIGDIFDNLVSHPAENSFQRFGFLVIFHLSFFIFITTIGLNIIFGIIVDTFSELRDLKWTAERDMRDTCFICSRSSYDFEHHGHGFEHHISVEHHIWSYIFFFIHLHDTKQSDYTSLEYYVHKLLLAEKYDFFPLNRALSLSAMDDDSTDSKVDDLLHFVTLLVERQKEDDARKKREEERQKQLRWREEHTHALMGGSGSDDSGNAVRGAQLIRQKRWQRSIKAAGVLQGMLAARADETLQSMDSSHAEFMPTTTKDSSQDDYMDTTAVSSLPHEDYSLQPPPPRGSRSPLPTKTPPRSPRSPPPPPQTPGIPRGSRLPPRLPRPSHYPDSSMEMQEQSMDDMAGDAVHLIDFEDIERDGEVYDTLSRAPSRRQSGVPHSPTREGFDLAAAVMMSSRRPSMVPPSQSRDTDSIGGAGGPPMSRRPSSAHPTASPTPPPRRSPTPTHDPYSRAPSHTSHPTSRATSTRPPSRHSPRHSPHSPRQSPRHTPRHSPEPPPSLHESSYLQSHPGSRAGLPRQESMLSTHSHDATAGPSPYDSPLPRTASKHSISGAMSKADSTEFGVLPPVVGEPMTTSQTSASTASSRHSDMRHPTDTETDQERADSVDLIDMDQPDDEESFAMGPPSGDPDTTDEDLKSTRL